MLLLIRVPYFDDEKRDDEKRDDEKRDDEKK